MLKKIFVKACSKKICPEAKSTVIFRAGLLAGLIFLLCLSPLGAVVKSHSGELYQLSPLSIEEKPASLEPFRGKVLLFVNTASRCGYTSQYAALQKLQGRFEARGFSVLGFPSNDFGRQEPGTNSEIKLFCKTRYQVSFPLFAKAPVGGEGIQPVYAWLLGHSSRPEPIAWNFEKFLISRTGVVLKRFPSGTDPESPIVLGEIEKALGESIPGAN